MEFVNNLLASDGLEIFRLDKLGRILHERVLQLPRNIGVRHEPDGIGPRVSDDADARWLIAALAGVTPITHLPCWMNPFGRFPCELRS